MQNDEKLDFFFSILGEREKQYFIAKERYEEALENLKNITIGKIKKYTDKINENKFTDIMIGIDHYIDENKEIVIEDVESNDINSVIKIENIKNNEDEIPLTLSDHMLKIINDNKTSLTVKEITNIIIQEGRIFNTEYPINSVNAQLNKLKFQNIVQKNGDRGWEFTKKYKRTKNGM